MWERKHLKECSTLSGRQDVKIERHFSLKSFLCPIVLIFDRGFGENAGIFSRPIYLAISAPLSHVSSTYQAVTRRASGPVQEPDGESQEGLQVNHAEFRLHRPRRPGKWGKEEKKRRKLEKVRYSPARKRTTEHMKCLRRNAPAERSVQRIVRIGCTWRLNVRAGPNVRSRLPVSSVVSPPLAQTLAAIE